MWNLTPIDCCKCNKCLLKGPVIEKKVFDNHIPKLNMLRAGTNWSSLNGCGQAHLDISKILQIQEPLISQGWTELWKQLYCALNVGRHPLKQQVDCKSWVIVRYAKRASIWSRIWDRWIHNKFWSKFEIFVWFHFLVQFLIFSNFLILPSPLQCMKYVPRFWWKLIV